MAASKKSISIQRKLIGFLLFASLVPLAAIGTVEIFQLNKHLVWTERFKLTATLTLNQYAAGKMLETAQDSILHMSMNPDIIAPLASVSIVNKAEKALIDSPSLYVDGICPIFSRLSLINAGGSEIFALTNMGRNVWKPVEPAGLHSINKEAVFKKIATMGAFNKDEATGRAGSNALRVAVTTRIDNKPGLYLLVPLFSPPGEVKGGLMGTLSRDFITRSFVVQKRGEMRHDFVENVFLATGDGEIIYGSDTINFDLPESRSTLEEALSPLLARRILAEFAGNTLDFKEKEFYKTDWVAAFDSITFKNPAERDRPIPWNNDSLKVIIRAPDKEFFSNVKYYRWLFQALLISFTIVSITTGVYLSRKFLSPIKELIKGTEMISRGKLDYEMSIKTGDEFEDLSHHFNTMVERLKDSHNQLEGKVVERTRDLEKAKLLLLKAKESIALEKERLEAVLNSTKEGIMMCQPSGEVVFSNRSCREMFDIFFQPQGVKEAKSDAAHNPDPYSREWNARQLIARRDVFNDPDKYLSDLEGLLKNMNDKKTGQIIKVTPHVQIIDWFSAPVRSENDEILGRIMAFRDVTKEKEVERMKDEFVSIVSHELRTPMTAINGSLSLVLDGTMGEINEDQQDLLETAKNNTVRLIRLINDILDISKIESGTIHMKSEPCDIYSIVKESLAGIQGFAEKYGVNAASELQEEIPPFLADRDRIIQVVTNLLSNAIKFSHRDGTVYTFATIEEEELRVAVKDEGIGIPSGYLGKVFEKFQQVDSSAVREKGGTGLGLPICKAIIEEHGGTMWVESETGKGSTFIFTMPIRKVEEKSPAS